MAKYFDEQRWREVLTKPDWYIYIDREHQRLKQLGLDRSEESESIKREFKGFLIKQLKEGNIALAVSGPDQDQERKPIDTVVIHHTASSKPYELDLLNITHLLNLYAAYYANPYYGNELELKGGPIWSNHLRDGKQVFYAYHWLIRRDGRAERLLYDHEIGWQAGNWEVNCRSVAICFDADFIDSSPSNIELKTAAELITNYPQISRQRVLGHREVNPKAACPGNLFLEGWKQQLLQQLGSTV